MVHVIVVTWALVVCLICKPEACMRAEGVHIRQTMSAYVTTCAMAPPILANIKQLIRIIESHL